MNDMNHHHYGRRYETNRSTTTTTKTSLGLSCGSIAILFLHGIWLLLSPLFVVLPTHSDKDDFNNYQPTSNCSATTTNEADLQFLVVSMVQLFQQLVGGILVSFAIGTGLLLWLPQRRRNNTDDDDDDDNRAAVQGRISSTIATAVLALCVVTLTILLDYHHQNNPHHDDPKKNDTSSNSSSTNTISSYHWHYPDEVFDNDEDDDADSIFYRSLRLLVDTICDRLLIMGMAVLFFSTTSLMISFWPTTTVPSARQHAATTVNTFVVDEMHPHSDQEASLHTPLLMESMENGAIDRNSSRDSNNDLQQNGDTTPTSHHASPVTEETLSSLSSLPPTTPKISATRRLLQLASSQMSYLYLGCIVLLVRLPFSLAMPHFVSTTLAAVAASDFTAAHQEIQWLLVAGTVDAILDFWAFFLFGYANQRIVRKLRLDLFTRLLCQEVAFFDIHSSGELSSRLNSDCGEMAGDLTWFFRFSIESVVRITGITVYMIVRCPLLGTCAIAIIPAVALINKAYGDWLHRNSKNVQDALADANIVAQEALSNIRTVIAFVTESQECERYESRIERQYQLNIQQVFMMALYYMVVSTFLINTVVQGTFLWIGSLLVARDELTSGILLAFMLYQSQLQNEVLSLMNSFTSLVKSSGASDKVFALIDRQPPQPSTGSRNIERDHPDIVTEAIPTEPNHGCNETERCSDGSVLQCNENKTDHFVFENVTFAYPSRPESIILNGLSLTIPRAQTVALVGTSGGGKTTIMNLLQRFYDPCSGHLSKYGKDLRTVDVMAHRKEIGIVTQDPILFQGSIRDNITYGCLVPDQVRDEHVIDAAKLAHAHSFIQTFPEGYDTMIGERGVQLSGGQKQRIGMWSVLSEIRFNHCI
jgi:ABC-type multidrug transport system fused ATPase/permease subunit